MALRLKQFDWVEQFIEEHKDRLLGADNPEEVYRFNKANLHFHQQNFDRALDLLSARYSDIYYELAARRLEIKIFYEIRSPLLDSKTEAFKVFGFRQAKRKLPDTPKIGNNNFIDLLRQMTNPATLGNQPRIEKLRKRLKEKQIIAERDWLAEKLNTLR